jgi:hypothetical protein
MNHVIGVDDIPGEEVVVHRTAGARPALRITAMLANRAREVGLACREAKTWGRVHFPLP